MTIFFKKKSAFFGILRLGIALWIIYYLINKYLFTKVISSISSSNIGYLTSACVLSIIFQILVSSRLKLLVEQQEIPISLYDVFKINLIAAFYGLFLPAKNITGGAIRFYELSKVNNKKAEALASIILDRIFATIALCAVGVLFWLMDWPHATGNFSYSLIFIFGILLIVIILLSDVRILNPLLKFFEILKLSSFNRSLSKFYESLSKYRTIPIKSLAFILILSVLIHFLDVLVYFLLTKSLGLNVSVVTVGWIRSATILATMVPVTISGLGVREGVLIFLLKPYGVTGEEAFALSILVFLVTILLVGIIGGLYEISKMMSAVVKCRDIRKREM